MSGDEEKKASYEKTEIDFADTIRNADTPGLIKMVKRINAQRYVIEQELEERQEHFTVCIFGSARVDPDHEMYREVCELAKEIGELDVRIVTGGGPGIMRAANEGAKLANPDSFNSFGVNIKLPREQKPNRFVDRSDTHQLFSSRLDQFIRLSNLFIATPGGIGTLLELLYMWQLNQVGLMSNKRIIAYKYDSYWKGLFDWMDDTIVARNFAQDGDMDLVQPANTSEDVMSIIKQELEIFETEKARSDY